MAILLRNETVIVHVIIVTILISTFSLTVAALGICAYPNLVAKRMECISLQSEIESIRHAYYPSEDKSGVNSLEGQLTISSNLRFYQHTSRDMLYGKPPIMLI